MKIGSLAIALGVFASAINAANCMDSPARFDFLPGWRHAGKTGEYHIAGIRMQLDEGWKTYWRVPGEGGIGPELEIVSSQNLRGLSMLFPSPKAFEQNDMLIIGYDEEVLFPIVFFPDDNDSPIEFKGNFFGGICEEVCIPISFPISASLPQHGKVDEDVRRALNLIPKEWNSTKRGSVDCAFEFSQSGLFATARMPVPNSIGADHVVFEYVDDVIRFGRPKVSRPKPGMLVATSPIYFGARQDLQLDTSKLRITVLTRKEVVDINGCGSS